MGSAGVTVMETPLRHSAELVKAHLEEAGIDARLVDEGIIGANPLLANAVGWIKVNVAEDDEERARTILDDPAEATDDDSCLSCGAPMPTDADTCTACGWSYSRTGEPQ